MLSIIKALFAGFVAFWTKLRSKDTTEPNNDSDIPLPPSTVVPESEAHTPDTDGDSGGSPSMDDFGIK